MFTATHFVISWEVPTDTNEAKSQARRWRKALLSVGASALGYGKLGTKSGTAIIQSLNSEQAVEKIEKLKVALPADGWLTTLGITEAQLRKSKLFQGRMRKPGQVTAAGAV